MPKSMYVKPEDKFAKRTITFNDIPVCEYDKTVKDEKKNFSKEDFLGMYADMVAIREFESMLQSIKLQGEYNGKKFTYPGPSHLAIGEEATAVGQAYTLDVDDFIFGTHRSHHEVIAKGLSAIKKLSDEELVKIMEEFNDGKNYEAKSVKSKGEKDGTSKITLKFKRLTYFNSCYVKIAINGKEYMIPTGSAGIKIDQSSTSRNNNGKTE